MTELRLLKGISGLVRTALHEGREYMVVPVVALMQGVIHAVNAPTAELVPLTTLSEKPERWNDKPVVLGHPMKGGRQCSANSPEIMASHAFGIVRDAQIRDNKLVCDAWLDPQRLESLGARTLLEKLRAGEMVDVSVGAYVQTADSNFRRVERLRVSVSLGTEPAELSARLLDRRGEALAVPVAIEAREENGQHVAVADATLASLAPGDYLVELTLGEGGTRHTITVAFRIVP